MDKTVLLALAGFVFAAATGVVAYVIGQLNKRMDQHDARDDERFRELNGAVDRLREDTVSKRHEFRNEVHILIGDTYNRLRQDLKSMEDRLGK